VSEKTEMQVLAGLIVNSLAEVGRSRQLYAAGMSKSGNTKRHHLWCEFGYQEDLSFDNYYNMYERTGAAFGVVHRLLDGCWIDNPVIVDGDESKEKQNTTPWEKNVTKLLKKYWAKVKDADRRNMVGHYSALLLQFKDSRNWDEEVDTTVVKAAGDKALIKMIPAWEAQIKPGEIDQDQQSETYGQPRYYYFQEQNVGDNANTMTGPIRSVKVHPSRIIMFCEGSEDESSLSGIPLLRAGFNDISDMAKTAGGSAEGFLKNASRQLGINMSKETDLSRIAEEAKKAGYGSLAEALNASIKKLNEGTDSALVTQDGQATVLAVPASDPTPTWTVSANQLAASVQIPFTILFGQQTGRLASDEDKTDFANRCNGRRNGFLTDRITALIERLWAVGVIEPPASGEVTITWSDLLAPSEKEKIANGKELAEIAKTTQGAFGTSSVEPNEIREVIGLEPLPDAENERVRPTEAEAGNPLDVEKNTGLSNPTSQQIGSDAKQQSRQSDAA
jgi:hypothetical protein